jgi:isopentenyl diphosphate isomerase/L-lactate dehydrogenase-like FMN-dependent dehydrogenase
MSWTAARPDWGFSLFREMTTPQKIASPRVLNVEDLRTLAHKRLPKVVFDYLDGGAEKEATLGSNCHAFDAVTFRPKNAVRVEQCNLSTHVLGLNLSLPVLLAPIGYSRLMHVDGEAGAAAAAGDAGTAYILSTISGHRLEDVRAASKGPVLYQLYLMGGREAAEAIINRAQNAGCSGLVVTVDTAVSGMRERDFRNGMKQLMGNGIFAKIPYLPALLAHPRWLASFLLDGGVPRLPNVVLPGVGPMPMIEVAGALARSTVTWEDFRWIRQLWKGPIVAKGVLTGDDARKAVDHGAAAVVVSNHGGRQLDCVSPTLQALPEIVKAANGQAEILMDGGIRRGSDVVKALCLGARAVLVGRAYAYGLSAAGRAGVTRALEILRTDIERTLRLLGCSSVSELGPPYVRVPADWQV